MLYVLIVLSAVCQAAAWLAYGAQNASVPSLPKGASKAVDSDYFLFSEEWFGKDDMWLNVLNGLIGQPKVRAIEIGSFQGLSAVWLLQQVLTHESSSLLCIDTFDGGPEYLDVHKYNMYELFLHNVRPFGGKVKHMRGYSQTILRNLPTTPTYDIAYIDGSHKGVHVLEDAVLVFPMVKVGGFIIFDDYLWEGPGHFVAKPEDRPRIAIDAFLAIYKPYMQVMLVDYQVYVQKTAEAVPAG